MKIHGNFSGGNAVVTKGEGNTVYIKNELRDTSIDWFYWAFCVEDADEGELVFSFEKNRLGYFGPAVSSDLKSWHWLGEVSGDSFKYSFKAGETVYFAHHILYRPERLEEFAREKGRSLDVLCKSPKGRDVPSLSFGEGDISIILTARHHASESTGSYVLEGVLDELLSSPIDGARVFAVPFVDYDGVLDGDQGKSRVPHDHNRDYIDEPIYPEVREIIAYADRCGVNYGFDFHSPWHRGGVNDNIFVVRNSVDKLDRFDRFSELLEAEITDGAMSYRKNNDYPPLTGWNMPSTNFACTMNARVDCDIAFTLENAYFGTEENKVSEERLIELGRCFARAMKRYIKGI